MIESGTDVLVVGGGPVGLTAACELRRRGVDCRIVDRLEQPPGYAKAVGIQPRTLEIWESMGVIREVLDAAIELRGQIVYADGREVARMTLELPPEVPYGFLALPQYETERLLREHLVGFGTPLERGVELRSFEQDADGVTATLVRSGGEETVRCRYLVGADGAHSAVRKGLGLAFEGDAFPEEYMLGDVEVDWSLPQGFGIRAIHQTDGEVDDLLVCIPLPGHKRYRMSMLVPPELAAPAAAGDEVQHGFRGDRPAPTLAHLQAVLDRLAPEPTRAANFEEDDPATLMLREAQLLVGYRESGWVGKDVAGDALAGGPLPGERAPDCRGLARRGVAFPIRLFELLRGPDVGHRASPVDGARLLSRLGRAFVEPKRT